MRARKGARHLCLGTSISAAHWVKLIYPFEPTVSGCSFESVVEEVRELFPTRSGLNEAQRDSRQAVRSPGFKRSEDPACTTGASDRIISALHGRQLQGSEHLDACIWIKRFKTQAQLMLVRKTPLVVRECRYTRQPAGVDPLCERLEVPRPPDGASRPSPALLSVRSTPTPMAGIVKGAGFFSRSAGRDVPAKRPEVLRSSCPGVSPITPEGFDTVTAPLGRAVAVFPAPIALTATGARVSSEEPEMVCPITRAELLGGHPLRRTSNGHRSRLSGEFAVGAGRDRMVACQIDRCCRSECTRLSFDGCPHSLRPCLVVSAS